jgi:hypothetical protein
MIKQVFSIFDAKAKAFSDPIYLPNVAIAERAFKIAANDPTSHICQTPTDYTLFHLGEWDDETGTQTPISPLSIGLASSYKD